MTRNVDQFQQRMADIGEYLANYALELDGKLAERQQAQAQAEAQAAAQAEAEQDAQAQSSSQLSFTGGAQIEGGRGRLMPAFYILWAAIAAFGVLVLLHAARYRKAGTKVTSDRRGPGTRGRH